MILAWTEYLAIESDIYYDYLNANGSRVYGGGGQIVTAASKGQYEPKAVVLNDVAYLIWADGISSGKTEILGLYAQKVNNETLSNDDPHGSPMAGLSLKQNYPNPFNSPYQHRIKPAPEIGLTAQDL
jgi:hypothetical protein